MTWQSCSSSQGKGNDDFIVFSKMMDGSRQVLEELNAGRVAAELSEIGIKAAVDEVRTSKYKDTEPQSIRIPDKIGGNVDILLGIK